MEPHERFDEQFTTYIDEIASFDLSTEEATTAMKNLETFSKCRPPQPDPEPLPTFVPETRWEKFKCAAAGVLDNETTRTFIKGVASVGGVGLVVWSTVHRDHVIDRQAIAQANQRQF